jgi:hypothetical protein
MNRRFIAAITALILAMDFASAAEPVDDAVAAANRGDTATALGSCVPLRIGATPLRNTISG